MPMGNYSIITRDDGSKQWAYKGRPLYNWKNDKKPGDITGDGSPTGAAALEQIHARKMRIKMDRPRLYALLLLVALRKARRLKFGNIKIWKCWSGNVTYA